MGKRFIASLLVIISVLFCSCGILGTDDPQSNYDDGITNTYVLQILFGDNAERRSSDEKVRMLMSALYLCCDQSGSQGQDKVDFLKAKGVSVPSLSELRIEASDLIECAHKSWEYEFVKPKENQNKRKELLQDTTNKIFDFGIINNWFGSKKGKCNSFSALLYYSHCLSDYLADDPLETEVSIDGKLIPSYAGEPYAIINADMPAFTSQEMSSTESFASYSQLDSLGRSGVAFGNIGTDIMPPSNSRQQIGMIKPSGWNQQKYKEIIGTETTPGYIYERSHLIAHELAGEDGALNLITGTNYLNQIGMPEIEADVYDCVKHKGLHVLYRVTPIYKGENLIASGVQIEAFSVEDNGKEICRNRYYYNVQPGFSINYSNGNNSVSDITIGQEHILPFAAYGASDSNPDLILEMEKHLKILFKDQENTNTYQSMMNSITSIASEARALGLTDNSASSYIKTKKYEHQFLGVLREYVPLLLSKEDFFKEVFK